MLGSIYYRSLILAFICGILFSCNRKTSVSEEPAETIIPASKDTSLITPEQPFKNQPNTFCTVIRKLDAGSYMMGKEIDDVSKYPKKYCLLDVCLDQIDADVLTIDIGEGDQPVTTMCKIIKIFNSDEEAKAYAAKFQIVDVKFEE